MENLKEVIDDARKRKGYSIKHLSERIGMTEQGFHTMLRKGTTKLSTLEKLSKELDLPVNKLLDTKEKVEYSTPNNLQVWEEKERQYKNTIENLLQTIRHLSLGKRRSVSFSPAYTSIA